jgi:hypothetical protein
MEKKDDAVARMALATVVVLAAVLGALWYFGQDRTADTAYLQTLRMTRLVHQASDALHAAAQSERQAVMAETDEDSNRYAQDAQNATGRVEALLRELKGLPKLTAEEGALIARIESNFAEYRKVDEEILALAVQNSNIKAQALSMGEAFAALGHMERALKPLLDGPDDHQARLALRALSEALRIQALHTPHIAEKTDQRMDALEKDMAALDKAARAALKALGAEQAGAKALAAYDRYWKLTAEIIVLSRKNTNVRSLALSLDRKTKVLAACDEALRVLEESIRARTASKATR